MSPPAATRSLQRARQTQAFNDGVRSAFRRRMYASPKRSALISGLLHAAAIVLVLIATTVRTRLARNMGVVPHRRARHLGLSSRGHSEGGGGGGARDDTPATKGPLPPTRLRVFTPPVVRILNEDPRLAMDAAILGPPELTIPAPSVWRSRTAFSAGSRAAPATAAGSATATRAVSGAGAARGQGRREKAGSPAATRRSAASSPRRSCCGRTSRSIRGGAQGEAARDGHAAHRDRRPRAGAEYRRAA